MTDVYGVQSQTQPLHNLISWPAVVAGAAVAVAFGAMLNLLGIALGAGSFNPFDLARGAEARTVAVAAGVWVTVANAIALFFGAFLASRATRYADAYGGIFHGLLVWAVAFFVAILITGVAGGTAAITTLGADQNAANVELSSPAAPPAGMLQSDGTYLQPDGTVTSADGTVVGKQDPPAAVAATAPALPVPAPIARKAADLTAPVALWAFLAMLLGAIGAVLGGRYGARRHAWEARLASRETARAALPE